MDFFKKAQGMAAQYGGGHEESAGHRNTAAGSGKTDFNSMFNSASSFLNKPQESSEGEGPKASQDEKGMTDLIHSAQALLTASKPGQTPTATPVSHPAAAHAAAPPPASTPSPVSTGSSQGHPTETPPSVDLASQTHGKNPSFSDMFSSAQTLYQGLAGREAGKEIDNVKVSKAAEDLLHGVGEYGHLNEGQYGEYLKKAEGYIHSYGAKPTNVAKPNSATKEAPSATKEAPSAIKEATATTPDPVVTEPVPEQESEHTSS